MNDLLPRLIAHMRWADALVADSLEQDDHPDPEAARLFAHIAAAEHVWWARVQGTTPTLAVWPSLTVAEARGVAADHAESFGQLLHDADAGVLARVVRYTNSKGHHFENALSDIVLHVTVHGEHHRGQIARLVRASGKEPAYTDYIQFARRAQVQK